MTHEIKAEKVVEEAKALAQTATSWKWFASEVFDQHHGIIARAFSPGTERQSFYDSDQYKQIQVILVSLMKKFGVAEGSRLTVDDDRTVFGDSATVFQKLDIEAHLKGVNPPELQMAKLSLPL